MSGRVLVLDDLEIRREVIAAWHPDAAVTKVATVAEAIAALAGPFFEVAYLDHDLQDVEFTPYRYERTGLDVAKHIAAMHRARRPRRVVVHSWNPDGGRRMEETLREAGVDVVRSPYRGP